MLTRRLGNRLGQLGWGLLGVGLAAASCGKGDNTPAHGSPGLQGFGNRSAVGGFPGGGSGGKASKAGSTSGGNAGEGGGEGGMPGSGDTTSTGGSNPGTGGSGGLNGAGAPVVHVTSPAAVSDPNDKAVLVADNVDVLCTATQATTKGARPVDEATILLEELDATGAVVETHPGTPTGNDGEYTARFITRKVSDNGVISFACQASDTSNPPLVGFDQIDTFIDHGPAITPVDPPAGDANHPPFATAVNMALHVAFKVTEMPIAKGDKGASIGDVGLMVDGKPFDLTLTNGQYTATVHLDDPKIFTPTPDGDQKIVLTAQNKRSPTPGANEVDYDFIVDGTGPVINIVSPHAGDVKSGKVQFVFTITDSQSGIDPGSVVATINNNDYAYKEGDSSWSYDAPTGTFTFYFDTRQIMNSVAQATLQVVASDKVGNMSSASVLLQLDNVPPIVDLDPAPMREARTSDNTCSLAFDPVGPAAASDLQTVYDFQVFRALVWEETNHAKGQTSGLAAGADLNSVVLYLQPKVDQGLLQDSDGDGYCDQLVTTDADTGKDLHSISLKPIQPQGSDWFGPVPSDAYDTTIDAEFPMPNGCKPGDNTSSPPKLCPPTNSSDMTRVISWDVDHTVPVIFGVEPLTGVSCTGYGWEINSVVSEGWICAAATAKDNNGNVGVSAPIRLCYDDGQGASPACLDQTASPPPSCLVDNCKLPPRFGSALITW
jgi:hypothetical protein